MFYTEGSFLCRIRNDTTIMNGEPGENVAENSMVYVGT